jgi:heme/copper-type cytochrome/quinol oxidase subunit 1
MLFILGFIFIFVLGGISGVMIASVPFDWQVHDTYFIVAHFHYVLVGGMVFPAVWGHLLLVPEDHWTDAGRTPGKMALLDFVHRLQCNLLYHAPDRVLRYAQERYTFLPGLGWELPNMISTIGAFVLGGSTLIFLFNVFKSRQTGALAGDNPWNAGTLEWGTASPPPNYNFDVIPSVASPYPLWDTPGE